MSVEYGIFHVLPDSLYSHVSVKVVATRMRLLSLGCLIPPITFVSLQVDVAHDVVGCGKGSSDAKLGLVTRTSYPGIGQI